VDSKSKVCLNYFEAVCRKRKVSGSYAQYQSITEDSNDLEWLGIERKGPEVVIEEEKMEADLAQPLDPQYIG
jgi:hypothetical protein